jgi:hypothetical protein
MLIEIPFSPLVTTLILDALIPEDREAANLRGLVESAMPGLAAFSLAKAKLPLCCQTNAQTRIRKIKLGIRENWRFTSEALTSATESKFIFPHSIAHAKNAYSVDLLAFCRSELFLTLN